MTAYDQAEHVRKSLMNGHADTARREVREFYLDGEIGMRLNQEIDAVEHDNSNLGDTWKTDS